ncbi:hypothetical protein [Stutzerimonas stutzeri]|uniref:hypothetical protein n=1 Tax=Stutzerimonas stutzeri TaxID=316 RepID=UPI001300C02F|nr:hypothetical protein [Stutzerimonas stutzeri]
MPLRHVRRPSLSGIAYASGVSSEGRGERYGSQDSVKIVSVRLSQRLAFGVVLIPGWTRGVE